MGLTEEFLAILKKHDVMAFHLLRRKFDSDEAMADVFLNLIPLLELETVDFWLSEDPTAYTNPRFLREEVLRTIQYIDGKAEKLAGGT